eukprot:Skav208334  [mRNA]  locus=scaffold1961:302512:303828:- [translate_table: standard]
MLCHGDEGRGRKKAAFLVTSYHSCLGFGTTLANETRTSKPYLLLRMNYSGSSLTHRLISGCLPKMTKDEQALQDLLAFMAEDCERMLEHGVVSSATGQRYRMACVNIVGDWAWLAKAGSLERSFSTVPKRPLAPTSLPKGICHWCHAGRRGFDFEDLSSEAAWTSTMFLPGDTPWKSYPTLLRICHDPTRPAALFAFDIWHSFHLGLGKSFVAGTLACISDQMNSSAVDARFLELTDLYLQYCDESRTAPYITALTKESCGWPDRKTFPNGQWSKGHVTTLLLHFIESWFAQNQNNVDGSEVLSICRDATIKINKCFRTLYSSDLWLQRNVANSIGALGMEFLECYQKLAKNAYDQRIALWPYMPKVHVVHHVFLELFLAQTSVINPLCWGVQIDEDYIGKKSRVARRVAPSQVILRVLQRSLQVQYAYWREAGFLKD